MRKSPLQHPHWARCPPKESRITTCPVSGQFSFPSFFQLASQGGQEREWPESGVMCPCVQLQLEPSPPPFHRFQLEPSIRSSSPPKPKEWGVCTPAQRLPALPSMTYPMAPPETEVPMAWNPFMCTSCRNITFRPMKMMTPERWRSYFPFLDESPQFEEEYDISGSTPSASSKTLPPTKTGRSPRWHPSTATPSSASPHPQQPTHSKDCSENGQPRYSSVSSPP